MKDRIPLNARAVLNLQLLGVKVEQVKRKGNLLAVMVDSRLNDADTEEVVVRALQGMMPEGCWVNGIDVERFKE